MSLQTHTAPRQSHPRPLAGRGLTRRSLTALMVALAVVGGVSYLAIKLASTTNTPAKDPIAAYLRSFSVLRQPVNSRDTLPADPGAGKLTAIRLVSGTKTLTPQWLAITATKQLCVIISMRPWGLNTLPSGCVPVATVAKDHQLLVYGVQDTADPGSISPDVMIVGGLAPDGISSVTIEFQHGQARTVGVVNNAFQFQTHSMPVQFIWTSGDGVKHHMI